MLNVHVVHVEQDRIVAAQNLLVVVNIFVFRRSAVHPAFRFERVTCTAAKTRAANATHHHNRSHYNENGKPSTGRPKAVKCVELAATRLVGVHTRCAIHGNLAVRG